MRKKSNFSVFTWIILFSVGLGVGFFIGNFTKERSELVQILPTEYTVQETEPSEFDDFKVYDSDKLLSDEVIAREKHIDLSEGKKSDEEIITLPEPDEPKTHEQATERLKTELESESQFYEHPENNVFKNLRAEPPYSVPQIDEKIRSLRVKRYLPPGNKGQHNENFEAEGIVGRK
jgi:hypothetical protein